MQTNLLSGLLNGTALLFTLAAPSASQPSTLDLVGALEHLKVSLFEQIGPGVVNVQVVRHDLPSGLFTQLQRQMHSCLADANQRGEITGDEFDLWRQWTDRFLELTEKRLGETEDVSDSATLGDWGSFFDEVYSEWLEKTVSEEETAAPSLDRFSEKIKNRIAWLTANLKNSGLYHREPIVLRQCTGFVFEKGVVVTTQEVALPKRPNEWIRVYSDKQVAYSTGELLGRDEKTNVAVIRLASPGSELLPTIRNDAPSIPSVGTFVYDFHHPFNQSLTVSSGEITGGLRPLPFYSCASFLVTSLPTSPGTMGAPLVNIRGQLVGMRVAFMRQGSMSEVTYLLPADQLTAVASQIIQHGGVERGCIGVYVDEVAQSSDGRHYVVVRGIMPDSPASKGGVMKGDVIVALDGKPVFCRMTLLNALSAYKPNDAVTLEIEREGHPEKVQMSLAPMPNR